MSGVEMVQVHVPCDIEPTELLGRAVYHRKDAGRAARGRIPVSLFALRENEDGISVDRLTHAPEREAIAIATRRASKMEPLGQRSFYGWVVVSAERAKRCGRIVRASPIEDGSNDYHADITYPNSYIDDDGNEVDHAEDLSGLGCWLPRDELNVLRTPNRKRSSVGSR